MKNKTAYYLFAYLVIPLMLMATSVTQSPHIGYKLNCNLCHTTSDWTVSIKHVQFDHDTTDFPLTGAHTMVRCRSCHENLVFNQIGTSCHDCHTDFHQGRMGTDCAECHTAGNWENHQKVRENHERLLFPLVGAHAIVDCESCHKGDSRQQFANTSTECIDCHRDEYNTSAEPNHKLAGFDSDCEKCHSIQDISWDNAKYTHPPSLPLTGGHAQTNCSECHATQYAGTSTECETCHLDDYRSVTEPNHVTGNYPLDCTVCHTSQAWSPATFNHDATAFPLTGSHRTQDCSACHQNEQYTGLSSDCNSCHSDEYLQTRDPDHTVLQLDQDCSICHNTVTWTASTFDHTTTTGYPLTGAHNGVDCNMCHTQAAQNTSSDCQSCHLDDFQTTVDPNHASGGYPTDCTLCHNTTAWAPSTFNHDQTAFPLVGAHRLVNCTECHTNNLFAGIPSDCYSCHGDVYANTEEPNHTIGQFDHDCLTCHNQTTWKPSSFEHQSTGFDLTGSHRTINCSACHEQRFAGTPNACEDCHLDAYRSTSDPNHIQENYPTNCAICHNTTAWEPAIFNHDLTAFPLLGAHRGLDCSECHTNNQYTGAVADCYSCHINDYTQSLSPNHTTMQLNHDCQQCHTQLAWSPTTFNHETTGYSLTGAHQSVDCNTCHQTAVGNTPTECEFCHRDVYNQTTDPAHVAGGYPLDCALCHSTTAWQPSTFDHNQTGFALAGAHTVLNCTDCHINNQYAGTSSDCYTCHSDDYLQAQDPNHSLGMDHNCTRCHSQVSWQPSSFNHQETAYPLTGSHLQVNCNLCHTSQYSGTPDQCENCHIDDYNSTSNPNHSAGNYPVDCTICHSTSSWLPATFDHVRLLHPRHQGRRRRHASLPVQLRHDVLAHHRTCFFELYRLPFEQSILGHPNLLFQLPFR